MAKIFWVISSGVMVGLLAAGAVVDTWLWWKRDYTITHFLRENPGWFWWPAGMSLTLWIHLGLHLFVRPR